MKKRNKKLLITSVILVIIGLVAFIVSYELSGNSIIEWLKGKYAQLIIMVLGSYLLVVISLLLRDKIRRM